MSKSGELFLQEQEKQAELEYQSKVRTNNIEHQMEEITKELSTVNLADYDQQLKDHKNEVKEKIKPKTKSVDGKALIVKSICEKITPLGQKFGSYSWRIDMAGNWSCYLNSKVDGIASKLFKEGSACALTLEEKGKWLTVKQVFYTF